jgi:hypothetical protein
MSIVRLGHSALVLAAGGDRLVITSETFGLAPGGIQLSLADLLRLRGELSAGSTSLSHWTPEHVETVDLRLTTVTVDPVARTVLGTGVAAGQRVGDFDPSRQRSAATPLVHAALGGGSVRAELLALIGAGPGSTPAGDDVVVGVLAGLHATGHGDAAAGIARELPPMLGRTTSASRLYLAAAADGRFAERVHELVRGLEDRDSAVAAARSAAGFGATSGLDLLSGIVAATDPAIQLRRIA